MESEQVSSSVCEDVAKTLHAFVMTNFPRARQHSVSLTDNLLEKRLVDSMGLFELMTYIEVEFDITVDDADATEENFGTISAMAEYIVRSRRMQ